MNIVILGPQGSGKGTQARLLAEKLGLFYFESGAFLREVAKNDSEINETINVRGQMVADEKIFSLASAFLVKKAPARENIIFDGYPRSIKQYDLLKTWLAEKGKRIEIAFFLEISEAETIRRLSGRRVCEKCGRVWNLITNPPPGKNCSCGGNLKQRPDDRPQAIKERLSEYHQNTEPLLAVLDKEGILIRVDGERPIDTIFQEILKYAQ